MKKYKKLCEVCDINMGQSPDSNSYNTEQKGIPFFQGNADFGELYPYVRMWCNSPKKIVEQGTLLISVRAPIGALNFASEKSCIGRGLAGITARSDIELKYIYYCLKAKRGELNRKGTGSTFKAISKNVLGGIEIEYISLDAQKKCSAILDKLNEVIRKKKKQIEYADELIKSRFVEMFGDETEFDRWPCCTISDIADICVGVVIKPAQYYTDKSKGIPAFRSLNIGEMCVKDDAWVYFTEEGHQKNKKSIIHKNDVLVVRLGEPGTACVVTEKYDGYNAVDIIIAHPDNNKVDSIFLAAFTNMPHGRNQIHERTGGAAQKHFNAGGYKALRIIMPSLDLQEQFANFVKQTDKSKLLYRFWGNSLSQKVK